MYKTPPVTLLKEQEEWLKAEASKPLSSISSVIRALIDKELQRCEPIDH